MRTTLAVLMLVAALAPAEGAGVRSQAYSACLHAATQRGLRAPRLCGCIAGAVARANPRTRAAAVAAGWAAAPACLVQTGRR